MYTKKNGRMTFKSNRRPNYKRNNNFVSKSRSKGNITPLPVELASFTVEE